MDYIDTTRWASVRGRNTGKASDSGVGRAGRSPGYPYYSNEAASGPLHSGV